MVEYSAYVGLDVHKETISVAVAFPSHEDPVFRGEIRNQRSSLSRLIGRLSPDGEVISFCYEAGPCGYGVYREIAATGHHCEAVAPRHCQTNCVGPIEPTVKGSHAASCRRSATAAARSCLKMSRRLRWRWWLNWLWIEA